jgi:hypothetical protein
MRDVASALEAYLAGRATGVVVPSQETAGALSEKPARHAGGIVIAPWMLWTAIAIVLGGFGITWQLIAMMMRGQASSGEIAVSQPFKDALSKGEANILVNQEPLQDNQLRKPIVLPEGDNNVQIKKGSELTPNKVIHSEKDNPTVLEKTSDGDISYTPLRRRIAEQVLAQQGQIKVAGSDVAITRAADLPTGRVGIDEIDLSAVQSIDAIDFDLIKRLKASLKRLVVPRGFSQSRIQGLAEALPNCEIKPAPETP